MKRRNDKTLRTMALYDIDMRGSIVDLGLSLLALADAAEEINPGALIPHIVGELDQYDESIEVQFYRMETDKEMAKRELSNEKAIIRRAEAKEKAATKKLALFEKLKKELNK